MTPLWIALAGGAGAATRLLVDTAVSRLARIRIPLGTLVVNLTGSFLLGLLTGWLLGDPDSQLRAVAGVGFLGGYTTFSTACVEAARLLRAGRRWGLLLHAAGMAATSVAAASLGIWLILR